MTRNNVSLAMGEINDSPEEIERIIDAIKETAFQTNFFALNVAISSLNASLLSLKATAEAAHVGDAGLGFAVVAVEVRNFAQRAAQAAQDTSQIIEGTVARIRNVSEIAATLDAVLKEINAVAKDVRARPGQPSSMRPIKRQTNLLVH